jgi:hypothetical protein
MKTYIISYRKPNTGVTGWIRAEVIATDMDAALTLAQHFCPNHAAYSWLAYVKE